MNYLIKNILLVLFVLPFTQIFGQSDDYYTQRTKTAPHIDGIIDEVWNTIDWGNDFIQYEPSNGQPATQKTSFKILYDDNNLFVLIRCFDAEADKIEKRLARRDTWDGDWAAINIDSYNDKRTAFGFAISAGGVKSDVLISNNDQFDETWNAVWYAKSSIDKEGWTAEMQIPLSQIRFADKENHEWGYVIVRQIFRIEELCTSSYRQRLFVQTK